jgi:hypothetical protein
MNTVKIYDHSVQVIDKFVLFQGYMSLLLPTWQAKCADELDAQRPANTTGSAANSLEADLPVELVRLERLTRLFTARTHWELSTTLTSNHLLAIIAMANTLMSMNNATFVPEQERTRKLHR